MLRSGPIPFFLHGIVEYVAAIAFLAAPFVLGFESDAATWLSVAVGVVVLIVAATTDGPTSLINSLPILIHVVLDYVLALALIAAPFVFGFSDETPPTAWFMALGVIHLLMTIGTRFEEPAPATSLDGIDSSTGAGADPAFIAGPDSVDSAGSTDS